MTRKLIATALIGAGVFWSIMFPKKASFDPDMVVSVCIGIGLIGSGMIVVLMKRRGHVTPILSVLLLWSLLGNVCLNSMNTQLAGLVARLLHGSSSDRAAGIEPDPPPVSHGR